MLTCVACGKQFGVTPGQIKAAERRGRTIRYCSRACMADGRRRAVTVECEQCGEEFQRKRSEATGRNFCSRACYEASRTLAPSTYPKRGDRHVHRIVAEKKLGRPLRDGEVVHHIDGDKHNNAPENLEITTASEHARKHLADGSMRQPRGEKAAKAKLTDAEVLEIRGKLESGETPTQLAAEYRVGLTTIRNIRDRKTWRHL